MLSVLKKIKASEEEQKKIANTIRFVIKNIKIKDAEAILGGSGAKDTYLAGLHDIDIYVRFNYSKYKEKDISSILEKHLKKKFPKVDKLHGSRDYFQIRKANFTIEIVPILKINNAKQAKNITDLSPLHAEWVKKYNLGDEIRLTKAFCKAAGCYGAESYIHGFSGYVLEVLTIFYGSFDNFIRHAAKWKTKEHIDIEKHGVKLNAAKKTSPLILIDPVQNDRNAAAAISKEKYLKFIETAKKYFKKPSEKFFFKKEETTSSLRKKAKGSSLVLIGVVPFKGKEDVVGAKIVKALNYITKAVKNEGFKIIECSWKWDKKAFFWYIVKKETLPKFKMKTGPPISQERHVGSFEEKNKDYKIFRKNRRVFAKIPRDFRTIKPFVKDLIKEDKNIKQWIKSLKLVDSI